MKPALPGALTVDIGSAILTIRGHRVILDSDLARIYGVPTKRLNEQVKRNARRFPLDFMFRLRKEEVEELQRASLQAAVPSEAASLRSQIATSKARRGGRRVLPYAFTEHGALMAANVLNSARAVEMSVYVIRAFVRIRRELGRHADLARRLAEIEKTLIGHDGALRELFGKIRGLLLPAPTPNRRRIGFRTRA